jgi:hypothetical protein
MRSALRSLPQMVLMAVIVATVLFGPAAAILAFLAFALFGVSVQGFITFGGSMAILLGLGLWWALLLVPSLVYAAYVMPWHARD